MRCERCGGDSEVTKTRALHDGRVIRRRRSCIRLGCGEAWTTYEAKMDRVQAYVPRQPVKVVGHR